MSFSGLSPRTQGILYIMFAVVVWTGWILLGRYSTRTQLSAYDISALRFGVAGILLLPVLIKKGFAIGPYGKAGSFWLAFMMGAPYNTMAIAGMHYAPASHAAAMINTVMLVVATLGGLLLLKEKTTWVRMLGVGLSILGISLISYASNAAELPDAWRGTLMFTVAATMWGCYTLSLRAWKVDPLHAAAAVSVWSLLYLPIYFIFIPSHIGLDTWQDSLFQALYQGVLNSIFALICFNRGVRLLGATTASAFLPLILILSTLVAIPLLQEVPDGWEWTGILLAAVGVFLSTGIISTRKTAK